MAMTLPSPASDAAHPTPASPSNNNNNNNNVPISNANDQSAVQATPANSAAATNTNPATSSSTTSAPPKRKPSRRANTAERRATHNAVERQRRETLNGRFLDLAALLPNLSQIRRPSKSSIVNSSIAHIQASRRHRAIASRELRMLKHECDAVRRELNEWRDRVGLPHVQEPVRGEGFGMVLSGELEVIQGVSVEEEDEDGDDAMGLGGAPGMHQSMQQPFSGSYMDDVDDDPALLGPMYPSHQATMPHHGGHSGPHHGHPQSQQTMNHHPMMAAHSPHDLEDPRMAAMLLKNASNPFAHNIPPPSNSGYPPSMGAGRSNNANYDNWGASAGFGGPNGPAGPGYGSNGGNQAHLFTPPATSHGLPTVNTSAVPASSASNASSSGSPVGGMSVNQQQSPVVSSHGSPLSNGGGIPLSVMQQQQQQAAMAAARRERSGSVMSSGGNGGSSPSYELHHPAGGPGEFGVPRRGGDYLGGMMGPGGFGHGPHHHGHGGMQPQAVGAGGSANGAMMMMMM